MFIGSNRNSNIVNIFSSKNRPGFSVSGLVILLACILLTFCFPLMLFAQATSPTLLQPADKSENIGTSDVAFTWSPTDNTTHYYLQLSEKSDFTSLVPGADPEVSATSYTLEISLDNNTKYYWRVAATQPAQSDWSDTFEFTTGSSAVTPTATATTTTEPTTTSPPDSEGSSFMDTIKGYIEDIGWPLILAIVIVLVVIILLVFALTSKPKGTKSIPASSGISRSDIPTQAGIQCPVCGYTNTPDKKFCANCGSNMMTIPPPQHQPQQTQSYTQSSVCPSCGLNNPQGSQFCGNCGFKLVFQQQAQQTHQQQYQQPPVCPNCGAVLQTNQKFCGNCGNTIATAGQQVAGVYQTFQCPICGASINQGQNPCPGCNTWLDWGR